VAVQVWVGEKPDNPNERKAIIALANGLDRLEGLYLMLANFSVGGRSIDLVILKRDAIFILELKHCDGKVYGGVNGTWRVVSKNGSVKQLNPGRKNPYNQVISYFYNFTNFLNEHKTAILSPQKASDVDFRSAKRVIVIVPTLEPGSEIDLDWKVQAKGLDELPTYLVTEQSNGLELSDEELQRIPQMLHCQPWQEVNDLIAGVMPAWTDTPTEAVAPAPPPTESRTAAPTTSPLELPEMPAPRWRQRTRSAQRWLGQVLAAFALVSIGVLVGVMGLPRFDRETAVPLPSPPPTLPIPSAGLGVDANNGVTTVNQAVAKRWNADQRVWELVASDDAAADVVITLETVNFNNGEIVITWSVENRRDSTVRVPLVSQNIRVTDSARMPYKVDGELSDPPGTLEVASGQTGRASVVIPQTVGANAITMRIQLTRQPFDASWFVNVAQPTPRVN
jgi:hypothetical protein